VLPEKIRLCFLGDPNRLPPIGFGVIFQKLIDVCGVQTIVLDTIVGHKNVTEISRVSDEVRNGHVPKRISFTDKSAAVCFVGCHETEIIKTLFDVSANLNHDCQILTTRQRQGVDCARKVNRFCQRRLVDFLDDKKHFSRGRLFVGDRVVVTNNNNDPGLFKGAIGQITSISITGLPVFRFCDNNYEFADEKISKLGIELAYAITVHNAQCSKFKRIVLPVIKPHGLDRSLIYTALTLAIEQVVFVGSWKVFRAAIMAESKIMATEVGFNLSEAMEV
jgi:exodeoxyribonuclease V alpha subunit